MWRLGFRDAAAGRKTPGRSPCRRNLRLQSWEQIKTGKQGTEVEIAKAKSEAN